MGVVCDGKFITGWDFQWSPHIDVLAHPLIHSGGSLGTNKESSLDVAKVEVNQFFPPWNKHSCDFDLLLDLHICTTALLHIHLGVYVDTPVRFTLLHVQEMMR